MNMKEIREKAREKLKHHCRVCPVCDGRACAGEVPGMGGVGTGAAFKENVRALERWKLNMRTLHEVRTPDTSWKLWGTDLKAPVMGAPMAGGFYNLGGALAEEELAEALHAGCRAAGSLGWSGDGADPSLFTTGLEAVRRQGGLGIPTIKPRGAKEIIARIRRAEDAGAIAVAVDVDTAGFAGMTAKGQPVGPTSREDIAAIVAATPLPVILKGIMTPEEAALAASLGVRAIVVSNHGGRVFEQCPGTADVLPDIAAATRGRIHIFLDGGVRSGADVLKALALGADAVLIGRPLIVAAAGGGAQGVRHAVELLAQELALAMLLTGTAALQDVTGKILIRRSAS